MVRLILLAVGAVVLWLVWSNDAAATGLCRVQLPYVAPASNGFDRALVRVLNDAAQSMTVQVTGYDDTGRRFGPKPLRVAPNRTATLTSATLEEGSSSFAGLGNGSGWWRLELSAGQPFRAGMYYRTADRFMTELTPPVITTQDAAGHYHSEVGFFNPGSNTAKVSLLRLANTADSAAEVTIAGRDDAGRAAPGGNVSLSLPPRAAVTLSARVLENGNRTAGLTGRLGDGEGKWRLTVTSDQPVLVMSLLHNTQTGHITNLSAVADAALTRTPPSLGTAPDLVVDVSSLVDGALEFDERFRLYATVRNSGDAASVATTLRWYLSADDTITTRDTPIGVDAIAGIQAGRSAPASLGLTAPAAAGTYRYGACVDPVCGESDTRNNCSAAVPVTVREGPDLEIGYVEADVNRGAGLVSWVAFVENVGDVVSRWTTLRIIAGAEGKTWDTDVLNPIDALPPRPLPPDFECGDGQYHPFQLPARGGAGQICVDPVPGERNTVNNCKRLIFQEGGDGVIQCGNQQSP